MSRTNAWGVVVGVLAFMLWAVLETASFIVIAVAANGPCPGGEQRDWPGVLFLVSCLALGLWAARRWAVRPPRR